VLERTEGLDPAQAVAVLQSMQQLGWASSPTKTLDPTTNSSSDVVSRLVQRGLMQPLVSPPPPPPEHPPGVPYVVFSTELKQGITPQQAADSLISLAALRVSVPCGVVASLVERLDQGGRQGGGQLTSMQLLEAYKVRGNVWSGVTMCAWVSRGVLCGGGEVVQ
jgi:hypothetical protein